ncbi:GTP pyrophosphokinase [Peptoclostridium litorale DSM 5388]|uniref:RelA/SpoT domain-containing protein n=1 Tax=Peptoclostridium litorale DSM 5388 TaxID=1121324 RepID=A0A069RFH6_PEPLI|nr:hypothetical protein [Peptoclostridium litorale]KDR95538.1 RelA/SpoT domain-containing protein [Peptoclostridium litorale DSM 5388]SIN97784.1 GTP pyrophosphokinase [Peptoclostridium litorale DSM 5388]
MDMNLFLKKYNITDETFLQCGLSWEELMSIYKDYICKISELEYTAEYLASILRKVPNIHSVKFRVKDPEHLIEKIIRKKIKRPHMSIDASNYPNLMTDLIGTRVIHLFKEDWEAIDKFIRSRWHLAEKPQANFKKGDMGVPFENFISKGFDIRYREFGYRSIHYLVKIETGGIPLIAEIQLRTIFEEAWSEIDHHIRYPYNTENPIISNYLKILNQLSSTADDMASFLKVFEKDLKK